MNTETIEAKNETKALAVSLSAEIVETCKAVNNTLETTEAVTPFYGAHYANAQLDVCGIVALVEKVLRDNQAVFPRGIEATALRKIAVAASMFTSEVVEAVKVEFAAAGMRYKAQAVKNVLSTYGKGRIAKIRLTPEEDQPRTSDKPRAKWYLIDKPAQQAN